MGAEIRHAPGWPGIEARWTSSAKSGVGTSLSPRSRVWFTLGHGILDEIYYPRIDQACIRDLGLIVTDGSGFFSEEKRHTQHQVSYPVEGCPAYRLVNTCERGRYTIEKEVLSDPRRDAVLQSVLFKPLQGRYEDYRLYVLLAPHLGNGGASNTAWVGDHKGRQMLFAQRGDNALALACSVPWLRRSVGFVGVSDGWQDLEHHRKMLWTYDRAENGNVALTGEIDLGAMDGPVLLALGFGLNPAEAGHRALASLLSGFEAARDEYTREWQEWVNRLARLKLPDSGEGNARRISSMVLRTHEAKRFPGGLIASLSIPWGSARCDDDLGGYHLAWPRDIVETAGALLAIGAADDVRRVLAYLQVTQEADGHWPQNMWMDGTPYWRGVQMDETALPILLVDLARREEALSGDDLDRLWPMVRLAARFVVSHGPVTQQDRWEEDPGYSPFTLGAEIAALLAAADLAERVGESGVASYLRETADAWNAGVERWTYVRGTELAQLIGVPGYYVRIAPPEEAEAASPATGFVPIKNRPPSQAVERATQIVSPDALALVRFGLRAPDDPRIVSTVKVIDTLLKVETPSGPSWHRYVGDGYGEHEDGRPFDGTGVGRAWPLLTGERAHYELAGGRRDEALRLMRALEAFADEGGMIPEQVWDAADIPGRSLFLGRPAGSAMPLVWAHAEHLKLWRSLDDGRVFDMPPQPVQRYVVEGVVSPYTTWRFNHKCRTLTQGTILRIEVLATAVVRWSGDDWQTRTDTRTRDTGLGMHVADLATDDLPVGARAAFTFHWVESGKWEGSNYDVRVVKSQSGLIPEDG